MCQDCGCGNVESVKIDGQETQTGHHHHHGDHQHDHQHSHEHEHDHDSRELSIEKDILYKNNQIAWHNRQHFIANQVICSNWISAPGSGKTAILERMIRDIGDKTPIAVIEGDQQTENDANRIREAGAKAVQINTGSACHLDADMIHQALHRLDLQDAKLLVIENVGNMVCPTAYDLGEMMKIAVISCPEGDDKPEKYPDLILASNVLLINKIDLMPYLDFDLEKCESLAKKINPNIVVFPVSAKTGEGLQPFYDWVFQTFSLS